MQTELRFEAAAEIDKGRRSYQEDALACSFYDDGSTGLIVLSDGMGGHAAGDVASRIVVSALLRSLTECHGALINAEDNLTQRLREAAQTSNAYLKDHVAHHPEASGMGATLLSTVVSNGALYWISIGDSPLYLFRNGNLRQINEDHSFAPQIDFLVTSGVLTREQADGHPNRNVLTSALTGSEIPRIDCPQTPLRLQENDIVIVASDGLQSLSKSEISDVVQRFQGESSARITRALMTRVLAQADADQDNVTVAVIKATRDQAQMMDYVPTQSGAELLSDTLR